MQHSNEKDFLQNCYPLSKPAYSIYKHQSVTSHFYLAPATNYNLPLSASLPVIIKNSQTQELEIINMKSIKLIPNWTRKVDNSFSTINARIKTLE